MEHGLDEVSTPEISPEQKAWDEVALEREAVTTPSAVTEPQVTAEGVVEEKPVEQAPAEKVEEKTTDPFAGLSPEVRAKLEKFDALYEQTQQIPQLIQSVNTANGRVAAMQREMDVARNAAKAVGNGPSAAQIAAAAASTDKWDSLKDDFPDWAQATEQYVKAQLAGVKPQGPAFDPNQVEALITERLGKAREEALAAIEEAKVEGKHENWRETINTPEFAGWLNAQPDAVKQLAQSPKGRDAIKLLDTYATAQAKPADAVAQERTAKLAAAVTAKPGAAATTANARTVEQMSAKELWNYEAKLAEKRRATSGLTY